MSTYDLRIQEQISTLVRLYYQLVKLKIETSNPFINSNANAIEYKKNKSTSPYLKGRQELKDEHV